MSPGRPDTSPSRAIVTFTPWFRRLPAVLVTSLVVFGCGRTASEVDLPAGWEAATPIELQQAACGGSGGLDGAERVTVHAWGDPARLRYEKAHFRCEQKVCAYKRANEQETQVLVQPCEMDPAQVAACDCAYDLTLTIPGSAGEAVEVYRRWDNLNRGNAPKLVARVERSTRDGGAASGAATPSTRKGGAHGPDAGIDVRPPTTTALSCEALAQQGRPDTLMTASWQIQREDCSSSACQDFLTFESDCRLSFQRRDVPMSTVLDPDTCAAVRAWTTAAPFLGVLSHGEGCVPTARFEAFSVRTRDGETRQRKTFACDEPAVAGVRACLGALVGKVFP